MENLHNYLPKDLVNIVEEYSKDRTDYNEVIRELTFFNNHMTILNFSFPRTLNYFHRRLSNPYASIYGGSLPM